MKDSSKLLRYFLYASLIILGIVIGVAIRHYYNMPIEETINIVDLGTLVVTIFLAVYIPEVLDRRLQVKRDKKDLIEKRIEELQSLYRRINLLIQGQEPLDPRDFLVIQNNLDVVQHKLETVVTLLTYSNMHTSFTDEINTLRSLAKQHKNLLLSDKETCLLIFKISEA